MLRSQSHGLMQSSPTSSGEYLMRIRTDSIAQHEVKQKRTSSASSSTSFHFPSIANALPRLTWISSAFGRLRDKAAEYWMIALVGSLDTVTSAWSSKSLEHSWSCCWIASSSPLKSHPKIFRTRLVYLLRKLEWTNSLQVRLLQGGDVWGWNCFSCMPEQLHHLLADPFFQQQGPKQEEYMSLSTPCLLRFLTSITSFSLSP